jgi:glycosyltransferase involved in cell wall biosynthesis
VVKDIQQHYPDHQAQIFALPFSPAPGEDAFLIEVSDAKIRYGVGAPYFIICNQFWKHKDHYTAFRALAAIASQQLELMLVCTGATHDYRFPGYFDELMQESEDIGIANRIKVLGMIPKADQMALLRGAIALVQPTLFEGGPGGGAVYDSVAIGQRAIVSDIAVNKEIDEPTITYFEAGNSDALASRMLAVLAEATTVALSRDELCAHGRARQRKCGEVILEALEFVVSG